MEVGVGAPAVRVGVLALQGGFAAHLAALRRLSVAGSEVRTPRELKGLSGLILPGGESTTLLHLMRGGMFTAIQDFAARGGGLFGTCAGAILMATSVSPTQDSLAVVDITVERNAYGRQLASFEASLEVEGVAATENGTARVRSAVEGVFIRAPRITSVGDLATVLARHRGDPVLVRQGRHLASTFHPELTAATTVHGWFVQGLREHGMAGLRPA